MCQIGLLNVKINNKSVYICYVNNNYNNNTMKTIKSVDELQYSIKSFLIRDVLMAYKNWNYNDTSFRLKHLILVGTFGVNTMQLNTSTILNYKINLRNILN